MKTFSDLQQLSARLTAQPKPKQLSIPDQVRIDGLLSNVGEAVEKLLEQYELPGQCDAKELSSKVYNSLLETRRALCWDSWPPSPHISDSDRNAIFATLYASPVALIPPEVLGAITHILDYAGPDERSAWENADRPEDDHLWLVFRTVWRWLGYNDDGTALIAADSTRG